MPDADFQQLWEKLLGERENTPKPPCPLAAAFEAKMQDVLFAPLSASGATRPKIAQAKYLLQEQYQQWYRSIPAYHLRTASNHRCLMAMYHECYDRLHLIELQLYPTPNLILEHDVQQTAVAVPQPPPPPPQIAGIFMGEDD